MLTFRQNLPHDLTYPFKTEIQLRITSPENDGEEWYLSAAEINFILPTLTHIVASSTASFKASQYVTVELE